MKNSNTYQTAREQKGIDFEQAADLLGIDANELRAFETGECVPSAVDVRHMALLYGVSADYLLGIAPYQHGQSKRYVAQPGK